MIDCTNRRRFLRDAAMLAVGAAAGSALPVALAELKRSPREGSPEARLAELNIQLPPPPKPVATYVPAVRVGHLLYVSGHGPTRNDGTLIRGKVGADLTLQQGNEAARVVGLNVLSTMRNALGSLDNVVRLVKTVGMVNAVVDFTEQPQVVNGFSDLMVEVFGPAACKGARSAVGMGSLPGNIAVEIESVWHVRD
jgi:enamine deaminase RidA (YjgF/YER057c/UK114 family)